MLTGIIQIKELYLKKGRQYSQASFFRVTFINGFSIRAFFNYIPATATTWGLLLPLPRKEGWREGNLISVS